LLNIMNLKKNNKVKITIIMIGYLFLMKLFKIITC
jgi:hypothetical protein